MKRLIIGLLMMFGFPLLGADINITNVTKSATVKGADEILMVIDGTKSRLVPVSTALDLLQFPSNSPPIVYTTNLYATYITNNYLFSTNINVYTQTVQCAYITNLYVTNVTANYVTNEYSYITNLYSTYITNEYLYTTNIYNDYLTNNYLYTTNVTANYITNNYLYTTNLYTSNLYATNIFTTNLYATNIYTTNLFVTNIYNDYLYTTNITANRLTVNNYYGLSNYVDFIVATNGFLMTTNPIPAQVLSVGRSYMTNIAGDMTLGAFANVPNNYTWAIYLYVTNSSATDYKITFPNGTKCQGHGTPPVIYVTNKQEAAFQITGYGQLATNVNWSPYY